MDNTDLKTQLDSPAGEALKRFLQIELNKTNSITQLKDLDSAEDMALEVKAHKKAVKILEDILSQIMTLKITTKGRTDEDSLNIL